MIRKHKDLQKFWERDTNFQGLPFPDGILGKTSNFPDHISPENWRLVMRPYGSWRHSADNTGWYREIVNFTLAMEEFTCCIDNFLSDLENFQTFNVKQMEHVKKKFHDFLNNLASTFVNVQPVFWQYTEPMPERPRTFQPAMFTCYEIHCPFPMIPYFWGSPVQILLLPKPRSGGYFCGAFVEFSGGSEPTLSYSR